jgi:hypothetical protein
MVKAVLCAAGDWTNKPKITLPGHPAFHADFDGHACDGSANHLYPDALQDWPDGTL